MIKIIALTTVETGSLLVLAKEKLGRNIAIDVDNAKRDIKSIPSVISCLKHFSNLNPDLSVWDHALNHITMSAIVTVEESPALWAMLQSTSFSSLLSESKNIAIFTGSLSLWLLFCVTDWTGSPEIRSFSNDLYTQLIFGGFAPFFTKYRQIMKNGYFILGRVN